MKNEKVNILKLMQDIAGQMRAQGLKQYKDVYTKGGVCFYCLEDYDGVCLTKEQKQELSEFLKG